MSNGKKNDGETSHATGPAGEERVEIPIPNVIQMAMQHYQNGNLDQADEISRKVLQVEAENAYANYLLGMVAGKKGNKDQAIDFIAKAVKADPEFAEAPNGLGTILYEQGHLEEALASFRQAIAIRPDYAEALNNLGAALKDLGLLDEAIASCQKALAINPDYAEAHNNLGNAIHEKGLPEEAAESYRQALAILPDYAEAHSNLGLALYAQDLLDEAAASCREALERKPDYADAHNNYGLVLCKQGQLEKAASSCRAALSIRSDYPKAHSNLGIVLHEQGLLDDAVVSYREALSLRPDFPVAECNLAYSLLLGGQFDEGWACYEKRFEGKNPGADWARNFDQPLWDGKPLEGRKILLYAEQGLGDSMQFIRYVKLVALHGGSIIVECQPELKALFASVEGIDILAGKGEDLPDFDVQAPLMSLPHIFNTVIDTIPNDVPYLAAEEDRIESWDRRLGNEGFRVGIAWQGNPTQRDDHERSIPLHHFEPLTHVPDVRVISLQKKDGLEQLSNLPDGMTVEGLDDDFDSGPDAFIDTAAVMMNLNLIVTSDTAIAHLAGALGRPVWVLLPAIPDWRWLTDREDSPWYPTMRLFRQPARGDWESVFSTVAEQLPQD